MSSEFSKSDAKDTIKTTAEKFKEIKPDTDISKNEANVFWYKTFDRPNVDDKGKETRDGDALKPNNTFEKNGYKYKTDDQGRVISAEGKLRLKDPQFVRDMEEINKGDQNYKKTDDRGHLIAHQFGGSDKLENIVPMDAKLNQGDFAGLENSLAKAVENGSDVKLKVEPRYTDNTNRPSSFRVSYTIDGEKTVRTFKNGGKS